MKRSILQILFLSVLMVVAGFSAPICSNADMIYLTTAFSNYSEGDTGYLGNYGTVEFTSGGTDVVNFTITAGEDLGTGADLQTFYFNTFFNEGLTNSSISNVMYWDYSSYETTGGVTGTGTALTDYTLSYYYNHGDNAPPAPSQTYQADGDGYFDGVIDFGNGSPQMYQVSFTITGDGIGDGNELTVSDFGTQSEDGAGNGSYMMAAHWQTTDTPEGSEYVGGNEGDLPPVPIPGAAWLILTGLGFAGLRKKFKKS